MTQPTAYTSLLLKRYALPDGQVSPMILYDIVNALEVKMAAREPLTGAEQLAYALGKLDEAVGSDPGFSGYLKSKEGDQWDTALEGLKLLRASGYLSFARRAALLVGPAISASRKERAAALKSMGKAQSRELEQLGTLWWQHNLQNVHGEGLISAAENPEKDSATFVKPDGTRVTIDLESMIGSSMAEVLNEHKNLMKDAPALPMRERGIDELIVDYFLKHVAEFDLPMTRRDAARYAAVQDANAKITEAGTPAGAMLALCSTPDPWVYGSACGDDSIQPKRFSVRHLVGAGADAAALKQLKKRLGSIAAGPAEFYAQVNGAMLMRETADIGSSREPGPRATTNELATYLDAAWRGEASGSGGFGLYPIELWESSTRDLVDWYEALLEGDPDNSVDSKEYAWLNHATSIGQVINSADHFVLVSAGDYAGKVLFTDHETLEVDVFADSFEEFIGLITGATSWFLQRVLSDWRFMCDDEQWVPEAWMEERILSDER